MKTPWIGRREHEQSMRALTEQLDRLVGGQGIAASIKEFKFAIDTIPIHREMISFLRAEVKDIKARQELVNAGLAEVLGELRAIRKDLKGKTSPAKRGKPATKR
jgi:hypothetical protein